MNKCILITIFICNISYAIPGQNKDFSKAKDVVVSESENVNSYGVQSAVKILKSNIIEFRKLKSLIDNAKHIDDVIDETASGLYKISTSYQKISNEKNYILSVHKKSFKVIDDVDSNITKNAIESNSIKINGLIENNDTIKNIDSSTLSKIEIKKNDISYKANLSVINSLKAKNKVWLKFQVAHNRLLNKLKNNSDMVDLLMFALSKNSEVYREAADVAMLRKNAKSILTQLSTLATVDDVLKDMERNWNEINDLINEIGNADFNIE